MRLAEYLLVFYVPTGLCIAFPVPGGPIPVLLAAALAVTIYLRRTVGFDRSSLFRAGPLREALPGMLAQWAVVSLVTLAGVAVLDREHLFELPRREPWLWLAIVVLYPLISVYPQELLFRAFLLHRYAPVFGTGRRAAAAGAAAFGFAHLLFGNAIAVAATVAGGWLFARRYQRTRSLLVVSVEHALYGITI
ncbi:MAG TPA: CPBP family glutamic-type intramembrane protease, partial [Actinoplanes sp.]